MLYPTHIPFIPSELTLPFLSYSNFNILPSKYKVKVIGEVKVWSHNVSLTFLSTYIPVVPCQLAIPFLRYDFFKKYDQGQGHGRGEHGKSQHGSKHSIDSHPFHSLSIGHPIHKIRLFQNLTLKIQGQGHGWGESWKSQHGSTILSTHIPLIPSQSAIPFLR